MITGTGSNMLQYTDSATGLVITVSPWNSAEYTRLLGIQQLQLAAIQTNNTAYATYMGQLGAMHQADLDGRTLPPAPTAPLLQMVDDLGKATTAPWSPPLPVFVPIKVNTSGSLVDAPAWDRIDEMHAILLAIAAKLGVQPPTAT
jgi:hypothetical protein